MGTSNALIFTGLAHYELSDKARIVGSIDAMLNEAASGSLPAGNYLDLNLGYALRPILDDRLNILAKYRYLYDMVDQSIDNSGTPKKIQQSRVFSIDAEIDLSPRWTIGGKLGGRLTMRAPDAASPLADNNAWLAVGNARYHFVHDWDVLIEGRTLTTVQAGTSDFGAVVGVHKQVGENIMLGGLSTSGHSRMT